MLWLPRLLAAVFLVTWFSLEYHICSLDPSIAVFICIVDFHILRFRPFLISIHSRCSPVDPPFLPHVMCNALCLIISALK
jgi:hypothetical protein